MFELVQRHGRDTVSFQGLESGYEYFFDGDDAVVAYVDTGGAWVAAGGPIAPAERARAVAQRFYLCTPGNRLAALRDSLRAFAGGSLLGFASRSLFRKRPTSSARAALPGS